MSETLQNISQEQGKAEPWDKKSSILASRFPPFAKNAKDGAPGTLRLSADPEQRFRWVGNSFSAASKRAESTGSLRLIHPQAGETDCGDQELYRRAGRKRSQAVDNQPVKLAEVVGEQAGDKEQIKRHASLLDFI